MPEESGANKMAHVQLTMALREALEMLKQRYGVKTQAEALSRHFEETDPDLLADAENVANIKYAQASKKPKSKK